jgi:DNA repair protein RecO (recombination protein O)
MQWSDEGFVLGCRKHGETSVILEVLTPVHGRHMGLVRGGRSRRFSAALQPGNSLHLTWNARLPDHLGTFVIEPVKMRAAQLMSNALGTYGVQLLASYVRLFPERVAHNNFYDAVAIALDHFDQASVCGPLMVRMECAVLEELGFGLDLQTCAATGDKTDLTFVSPKSARAVSATAGAPYRDKLLPLPSFLTQTTERQAAISDILAGFRLTGYFLNRHVFEPREIDEPQSRIGFIAAVERQLSA